MTDESAYRRARVGRRMWVAATAGWFVLRLATYELLSEDTWRALDVVLLGPAFWFSAAMVVYRSGWLTGWRARSDDKTEAPHG